MANSIWTQAATAILSILNIPAAPCVFYRARFEAVADDEVAGNLMPQIIDCRQADSARDSMNIDFSVVLRCYTAAACEVDLAADPLVVWAWQQIRKDPTLGGLASDAYIDKIEFGYLDKGASDQVCVDITVHVEVTIGRDDPTINMLHP
jgi:hypothetical protein